MRCSQLLQEPIKPSNWRGSNIPMDPPDLSFDGLDWKPGSENNFQLTPNSKQWQQGIQEEIPDYLQNKTDLEVLHTAWEVFVISPLVTSTPSQTKDGYRSSLWIIRGWRKNIFQDNASSSYPLRGWIHC